MEIGEMFDTDHISNPLMFIPLETGVDALGLSYYQLCILAKHGLIGKIGGHQEPQIALNGIVEFMLRDDSYNDVEVLLTLLSTPTVAYNSELSGWIDDHISGDIRFDSSKVHFRAQGLLSLIGLSRVTEIFTTMSSEAAKVYWLSRTTWDPKNPTQDASKEGSMYLEHLGGGVQANIVWRKDTGREHFVIYIKDALALLEELVADPKVEFREDLNENQLAFLEGLS